MRSHCHAGRQLNNIDVTARRVLEAFASVSRGSNNSADTVRTQDFKSPDSYRHLTNLEELVTRRLVRIEYVANLPDQRVPGKRFLDEREARLEDAVMVNGVFCISGHVQHAH